MSAEQKEKVYPILLNRSTLWEKTEKGSDIGEKKRQIEPLNAKTWKSLDKVLTEEQKEKYKQLRTDLLQQKEKENSTPKRRVTDEDLELDF